MWVVTDAAGSRARASHAAQRAANAFVLDIERIGPAEAPPRRRLRSAVDAANATVYEEDLGAAASLVFATSLVAALAAGDRLFVAHVGNARCYRFRPDGRALLTRPQSAVAELELDENSAFAMHHRHLLTGALGIARSARPEISEHVLRGGELFVLVNDALSWAVEAPAVAELFVQGASSAAAVAAAVAGLGDTRGIDGVVVAIAFANGTVAALHADGRNESVS